MRKERNIQKIKVVTARHSLAAAPWKRGWRRVCFSRGIEYEVGRDHGMVADRDTQASLVRRSVKVIQSRKDAVTPVRRPKRARSTDRFISFYFSNLPQQELSYYAHAFLEAARTLLRSLRRRGGFSKVAAAPVLFMYRHAIELYLKSIVILGNRSLAASPADDEKLFKSLGSHKLLQLLPRVEDVFKLLGWEWQWPLNPQVETIADVQQLLADLENIDPGSFAFRYPVDKRGRRSISTDVQFNLESVAAALDALAEALDTADAGLRAELGL